MVILNREAWLTEATKRFCEDYLYAPDLEVHVSVSWPSRGGLSMTKRRIGECWKPETSRDGKSHVFISPLITDSVTVLATLLHELIHALDRCESGHRGAFVDIAQKVGLEKPWTATTPGVDLTQRLVILAEELGPYPHVGLEPELVEKKKQSTRQLKVECVDCGYVARVTRKWLDVGAPSCPCGAGPMLEVTTETETT